MKFFVEFGTVKLKHSIDFRRNQPCLIGPPELWVGNKVFTNFPILFVYKSKKRVTFEPEY
jgi:hypothetical protein